MTVVEILDANGAKKKIDVQTSGEGLEQLVADLGVKAAVEAVEALLESTLKVQLQAGTNAAGKVIVTSLEGEPKVKLSGTATVYDAESITLLSSIFEILTNGNAQVVLAAGPNVIGKLAANAGVNIGSIGAQTAGGCERKRVISAASTNATSVKASAGQVYGWYLYNAGTAPRHVKLYNKASAPTVGTDTPVETIALPGGAAANVFTDVGVAYSTGIALAITKGMADSNTEAVAAEEVLVNLYYK